VFSLEKTYETENVPYDISNKRWPPENWSF
jgi:hypothetical protein